MIVGELDRVGDGAAGHQLRHDVRLAVFLADVEDRDDVRVVAETGHRPSFTVDPSAPRVVEPVGLDDGYGDVSTETGVAGHVDNLASAFAEQPLHPISPVADR